MVEGPVKTAAGDRTIPIPASLCDALSEMLAARVRRSGIPIDSDQPLFVNRLGGPLNRDKFRETVVRPALRAAGLPEGLRTYDLRHCHATLIHLGANVLAIAQRTGHSDPGVTLREYGHIIHGVQEELTAKLDQYLQDIPSEPDEAEIIEIPVTPPCGANVGQEVAEPL